MQSGKHPGAAAKPFGRRRMAGLGILTAVVAGAVAFMQVAVPLAPPSFALAEATHYWQVAMIAALGVLIAGGVIGWLALAAARRSE